MSNGHNDAPGGNKPRYGSLTQGTTAQKTRMRIAVHRNRIRRLQRKSGVKFPKH